MVMRLLPIILSAIFVALWPDPISFAQEKQDPTGREKTILDPLDPFDLFSFDELNPSGNDDAKSADELTREGALLLSSDRPLDARTKLLKAI